MKKYKGVAMGFVAGAMCMVSVTAMAATYAKVQATVLNDVFFKFNGEVVASPSDQPVLNYNGYTYLPVRFVGESLDADVNWDPAKRMVSIDLEPEVVEKVVEVEVPYYVTDPDKVQGSYEELPVKYAKDEFEVKVNAFMVDKELNRTKIALSCYNKSTKGKAFTIVNGSAKLVVDGNEVDLYPIPSKWDQQWGRSYITKISKDSERTEGFLMFEYIKPDWEKAELTFDVMERSGEKNTYKYKIYNDDPYEEEEDED